MPFEIRLTYEAHYDLKDLRAFDRTNSLRIPAVAVLVAVHLIAGIDCRADSDWQTITLVEQQGFSIRLKVRPVASLADESWLLLELENQSSAKTFVENLHYRIEYKAKPVGHASGWSSGLCQGSDIEVFPRAWDTTPVKSCFLEKGRTYEVMEPLSYSAAATLQHRPRFSYRCPQNVVLDVSAKAHFTLTVSYGYGTAKSRIETPLHGIPFEFRWEPPDESAIPELQQRLKRLCKNKDGIKDVHADPSTRLACALFEIPAVTAGLSDAELNSTSMLTGAFNRELSLAAKRSLFERDPADRRYLDGMVRMIQENPIAVERLADSEFWHPDLTEAVVSATRHREVRSTALRLLEAHRSEWEYNAQFVQPLTTIEQERAWQSRDQLAADRQPHQVPRRDRDQSAWNRYGLVTIVLGAFGIVALLVSIRFWKRRKRIT